MKHSYTIHLFKTCLKARYKIHVIQIFVRLTLSTDYALRLLMLVALEPEGLVTIEEVATRFDISKNHLMKVAYQLGQAEYGSVAILQSPCDRLAGCSFWPLRFAVYSNGDNLTGGHPLGCGLVSAFFTFVPGRRGVARRAGLARRSRHRLEVGAELRSPKWYKVATLPRH